MFLLRPGVTKQQKPNLSWFLYHYSRNSLVSVESFLILTSDDSEYINPYIPTQTPE